MLSPALTRLTALLLLCATDPRAASAGLADPTRPLGSVPATASVGAPSASPAAAAPAASAAAPAVPQLQSLQLPRDGEPSALVDGQLLRVGHRLNGYEVTAIDAQGVLVRGAGGRQRWTLLGVQPLDGRAATERLAGQRPLRPARPAASVAPAPPGAPVTWSPAPRGPAGVQASAAAAAPGVALTTRLSWADLIGPPPAGGATQPRQENVASQAAAAASRAPAATLAWARPPLGRPATATPPLLARASVRLTPPQALATLQALAPATPAAAPVAGTWLQWQPPAPVRGAAPVPVLPSSRARPAPARPPLVTARHRGSAPTLRLRGPLPPSVVLGAASRAPQALPLRWPAAGTLEEHPGHWLLPVPVRGVQARPVAAPPRPVASAAPRARWVRRAPVRHAVVARLPALPSLPAIEPVPLAVLGKESP